MKWSCLLIFFLLAFPVCAYRLEVLSSKANATEYGAILEMLNSNKSLDSLGLYKVIVRDYPHGLYVKGERVCGIATTPGDRIIIDDLTIRKGLCSLSKLELMRHELCHLEMGNVLRRCDFERGWDNYAECQEQYAQACAERWGNTNNFSGIDIVTSGGGGSAGSISGNGGSVAEQPLNSNSPAPVQQPEGGACGL